MTEEQLAAIKARLEAASPGEWEYDGCGVSVAPYGTKSDLAHVFDIKDAEFIAHARQDIPLLIAEVERLRNEIETEKKASKWLAREGALLRENLEDKNDALRAENEHLQEEVERAKPVYVEIAVLQERREADARTIHEQDQRIATFRKTLERIKEAYFPEQASTQRKSSSLNYKRRNKRWNKYWKK